LQAWVKVSKPPPMGVPARFAGAPLCASQKPASESVLELILRGLSKKRRSLVMLRRAVLSETAGAGNGLIRKACIDG
jgi:hypothetical protein